MQVLVLSPRAYRAHEADKGANAVCNNVGGILRSHAFTGMFSITHSIFYHSHMQTVSWLEMSV